MQVAEYAALLGMEMGLDDQGLEMLYTASMLHDIGKLAVSPEILHKNSGLTPEEERELQIHPVVGADILEEFAVFYELAPIVRHHHERYDGTGYPGKLKGDEIPLLSRIITLADAFDVMTSYRPDHEAFTLEQVREKLLFNRGKQFDPQLVEVAVRLMDNGKLTAAKFCAVPDTEKGRRKSG
nr:HD-GYP domain-containing protein [Desulforadius tongensis]